MFNCKEEYQEIEVSTKLLKHHTFLLFFNALAPQMHAIRKGTESGFLIPLTQFLPYEYCPAILRFLQI